MDRDDRRKLLTTTATVLGAVFLLIGIVGFFITGFDDFAATDTDEVLLFFEINPLHNIVHLLIGGALLAGGLQGTAAARTVLTLVGVVYALVGVLGFFVLDSAVNLLSLNLADNFLHLGTAAVALAVVAVVRSDAGPTGARRPN